MEKQNKIETHKFASLPCWCRGEKTRTSGLYVPNVARYQLRHTPFRFAGAKIHFFFEIKRHLDFFYFCSLKNIDYANPSHPLLPAYGHLSLCTIHYRTDSLLANRRRIDLRRNLQRPVLRLRRPRLPAGTYLLKSGNATTKVVRKWPSPHFFCNKFAPISLSC